MRTKRKGEIEKDNKEFRRERKEGNVDLEEREKYRCEGLKKRGRERI